LWSTGQTSQTIDVSTPEQYWVQVNTGNCMVYDTINVVGAPGEGMIFIPNTFTPNGNGLNEKFSAVGDGIVAYHMRIFDRWGMMLYETTDINSGWDGKFHNRLVQEDTYVYVIDYRTECAEEKMKRTIGHVNVIR
jgi:gliding motility-associated-like protein